MKQKENTLVCVYMTLFNCYTSQRLCYIKYFYYWIPSLVHDFTIVTCIYMTVEQDFLLDPSKRDGFTQTLASVNKLFSYQCNQISDMHNIRVDLVK